MELSVPSIAAAQGFLGGGMTTGAPELWPSDGQQHLSAGMLISGSKVPVMLVENGVAALPAVALPLSAWPTRESGEFDEP